jgi:membrane-bound metal-dependent hydrolase YbcI (DUF457 family)
MMGRTHAAIGALSVSGALLYGVPAPQVGVMAVIAAGAALGPDLDHGAATASRSPLGGLHKLATLVSMIAWSATATKSDRKAATWAPPGKRPLSTTHRTLTHTTCVAALAGVSAALLMLLPFGTVVLVLSAALLMWRLLGARMILLIMVLAVIASLSAPLSPQLALWAAGGGWMSHILADACTTRGVPLAWPLKISGKRWYRFRLLGSALRTGEAIEWVPAIGIAVLLNAPLAFLL